jgi:exosome complex exonuclease RRP6
MDPKEYPEWQGNLLKLLVATTKSASTIASHDISFERSVDKDFNDSWLSVTNRLLGLSNRLLEYTGSQVEGFEDEDDLDNRWYSVIDVVDSLLEKAV